MSKYGCEACLEFYNSGGAGGLNCAESTMYGIAKTLGLDSDELLKMATPLGGGMGRNGYTCGSLAAGLLILGMKFGRNNPDDPRDPAYAAADKLINKFTEKFGAVNCRELTGLDLKAIDNTGEEKQRVHKEVCRPIVLSVCEWVNEIYAEADTKA